MVLVPGHLVSPLLQRAGGLRIDHGKTLNGMPFDEAYHYARDAAEAACAARAQTQCPNTKLWRAFCRARVAIEVLALEMRDQGLTQTNPDGTLLSALSGGNQPSPKRRVHRPVDAAQRPTSSAATDINPKGLAMVLWSPSRPGVTKAERGRHSRPVFKAVRDDNPTFSPAGILGDFASSSGRWMWKHWNWWAILHPWTAMGLLLFGVWMFGYVVSRPRLTAYCFINMLSYCTEFFSTSGAELATRLGAWFGVVGNSWMRRGRQAFALNVKDQRRVAVSTIRSAARSVANASSWLAHGDAANAPTVVASLASSLDALAEAARDLDGPDPDWISTTTDEMDVLPGQGLFFVALSMAVLKKLWWPL